MVAPSALPYNGPMAGKVVDDIYSLVGRRVREERKARGLTQDFLASKIEIGPSHFSNLERGKRQMQLHTLDRLAKALRIPIHELLLSAPHPKPVDDPSVRRITELVRDASPKRRAAILKVVQTLARPD
ncbi:XRE family transcriptional regulator [bacterium]|nr:MAG: XRE family transcriptional regulator [bacterium]